jgi:hypothetical protein
MIKHAHNAPVLIQALHVSKVNPTNADVQSRFTQLIFIAMSHWIQRFEPWR